MLLRNVHDSKYICYIEGRSLQFVYTVGLAAGVYSGLTYGLKEARGSHDWVMFIFMMIISVILQCRG